MKTLSTGQPSTLGSYYDNCVAIFGAESKPALYFKQKIDQSPNGREEIVIADETQVTFLISSMLTLVRNLERG